MHRGVWLGVLVVLILSCVFLVAIFVPLPYPALFYPDTNKYVDTTQYELLEKGPWATVWKHKTEDHVLKVIGAPGVSHSDYRNIRLPTPFRRIRRGGCTVPPLIAHQIVRRKMMKSYETIQQKLHNCEHFARVLAVDRARYWVYQEYVPRQAKGNIPANLEKQLRQIDKALAAQNLVADDAHLLNMRVSNHGVVKIIDGEVMTKKQFRIQSYALTRLDRSQRGEKPRPLSWTSNVYHWQDGRPNIVDCFESRDSCR